MSKPVIQVENLSKAYRIGLKEEIPDTAMGALMSLGKSPWRNFQRLRRLNTFGHEVAGSQLPVASDDNETNRKLATNNQQLATSSPNGDADDIIWAVKDVSFDVRQGEVLGIIGRNGSGKSTLLKILSRITEPTRGRAVIQGRVSSLLEVGTGFHPELTGRENIYMNGVILGMSKREIDRKFDEIVDFSGVEKFLDTPIKRYSSGMKVRLAFAVAAHLEPEILIIDEVLAVGDAEFQQKCLGKMQEVGRAGRTVIFVSHNMVAIQNLCERVCVLDGSQLVFRGESDHAIDYYLDNLLEHNNNETLATSPRNEGLIPVISRIEIRNTDGRPVTTVGSGDAITVVMHYKHDSPISDASFSVIFESQSGIKLFCLQTRQQYGAIHQIPRMGVIKCHIPRLPLLHGTYFLTPGCGSCNRLLDRVPRAYRLTVSQRDVFRTGYSLATRFGWMFTDAHWEVASNNSGRENQPKNAARFETHSRNDAP